MEVFDEDPILIDNSTLIGQVESLDDKLENYPHLILTVPGEKPIAFTRQGLNRILYYIQENYDKLYNAPK